jgi:YidC/Oxa1 family membrane protein insertase
MSLDPFFQIFGGALALFYEWVPNYGFIIVALTLVVMIVVTPLTLKATRSMMMMQQLQPEMKKLQSRYKDDRQKLNEELMKFYKENNINPVGGCLPLLIQMPVFFLLYAVLRGLTLRVPVLGTNTGFASGQRSVGINPLQNPPDILHFHNFEPKYVPTDSSLYQSLSSTNVMNFFGMDLASSCTEIFSRKGAVYAIPYVVLIIIVGATSFIQQRQIQGRNPNAQINPQQQQIMKIMPFFLPLISFGLPSGLVLYFAVSNIYRVGQQWFIGRTIYGAGEGGSGERAPRELTGGDDKPKSRFARKPAADADDDVEEAAPAGASKKASAGRSTKVPAKSGSKSPGSKPGTKSAAKPAAKSGSDKGRNGAGASSGTGRTTAGGAKKPAARAGEKGSSGSSSGRGSSRTGGRAPADKAQDRAAKERSNGATGGSGDSSGAPPTLQPRARRKKG